MTEDLPVLSVPTTYESLPVTIKAVQWDGTARHATDIIDWIHEHGRNASYMCNEPNRPCTQRDEDHHLIIRTLEGNMDAEPGTWIIQGTEGEFYPCKDSVFRRKYRALPHRAPQINVSVPVINIQGGVPTGMSPEAVARQMAKRLGVNRG